MRITLTLDDDLAESLSRTARLTGRIKPFVVEPQACGLMPGIDPLRLNHAPFHQSAKRWWEGCVGGSQPVAIPWVVALGFVRLMTSRAVLDAHIAALAIETQAVVHSNDSDFSRFPGLRWINPLAAGT